MKLLPNRRLILLPLSFIGVLALTGCTSAPVSPSVTADTHAIPALETSQMPASAPGGDAVIVEDYPRAHVHGMAVIGTDQILLATHEGLYDMSVSPARRIGPLADWMGFSLGADGFYASGHPGPGTDLENPVGLMRSTDKGKTWANHSRSAISDFHALTVFKNAVIGFDGMLRCTTDGKNWQELDPRIQPVTLAADPNGSVVLATTEQGIWRSADDGKTFREPVPGDPVLQYVAMSGKKAVGSLRAASRGPAPTGDRAGARAPGPPAWLTPLRWAQAGSKSGYPAPSVSSIRLPPQEASPFALSPGSDPRSSGDRPCPTPELLGP